MAFYFAACTWGLPLTGWDDPPGLFVEQRQRIFLVVKQLMDDISVFFWWGGEDSMLKKLMTIGDKSSLDILGVGTLGTLTSRFEI